MESLHVKDAKDSSREPFRTRESTLVLLKEIASLQRLKGTDVNTAGFKSV
jgi:hypothetical protein